jgi:hypothetical protein
MPELTQDTGVDYQAKNSEDHQLHNGFEINVKYVFISDKKEAQLSAKGAMAGLRSMKSILMHRV